MLTNVALGGLLQDMIGFALAALWLFATAAPLTRAAGAPPWWAFIGRRLSVIRFLEFSTSVLPGPLARVADTGFALTFALSLLWLIATGVLLSRSSTSRLERTARGL